MIQLRHPINLVVLCTPIVFAAMPSRHLLSDDTVSFTRNIASIFLERCVACHGAKKSEGGYRIDTYQELTKSGDSGEPPIVAKDTAKSEILRRISATDGSERMPPESDPLTPDQTELVSKWLAAGALFDGKDPNAQLAFVIPTIVYPDPPETYPATIPITAVTFSPDGKQIVVAGYHEVTIWNAESGTLLRRIKNIGQRVFAMKFSPDAKLLAVACGEPGRNGEVRLIDFASGEVKSTIARSTDVVFDIAFRPAHHELAVASADHSIRVFNTDTWEITRTLASHADWVTAINWNVDGTRLASASRDKSAKIYDGDTGQLLVSYQGHSAAVRGIVLLPDGTTAMSSGSSKSVHRWKIADGKKIAEIPLGGESHQLILGDGFVLAPCTDGRLVKIDLSNNKVTTEFVGHTDWVLTAAVETKPNRLVSGSFNGEVRLWNQADGSVLKSWFAKP